MRQSNVIFATIVFAFIVYITIRGQLPAYLNLFTRQPYSGNGAVTPSSTSSENSSSNEVNSSIAIFDKFSTMFG